MKKSLLHSSRFWHWVFIYPLAVIGVVLSIIVGFLFFDAEETSPYDVCINDNPCYDLGYDY